MKIVNLMLFLSLSTGIAACSGKTNEKNQDKDATGQFLNEFAGKTDARPDSIAKTEISSGGSLTFYDRPNRVCSMMILGRIEKAIKYGDGQFYGVTYRYERAHISKGFCDMNLGSCKLDLSECDQALGNYNKRMNEGSKTLLVKIGQDPKTVNLLP